MKIDGIEVEPGDSIRVDLRTRWERIKQFFNVSRNGVYVAKLGEWSADDGPLMTLDKGKVIPVDRSMTLTERRAEFVYNAARLAAIAAGAPIVPILWAEREEAFRAQMLPVIERQCGPDRKTSPEELHNDWVLAYLEMGWAPAKEYSLAKRLHPDMVPYNDLGQLERDKDEVFVALCEIARQWVY